MSSSMIVGFVGMMIPPTAASENCHPRKTGELNGIAGPDVRSRGRSSTTDGNKTQEQFVEVTLDRRPHRSPCRRGLRGFGVARREKHVHLMGRQGLDRYVLAGWPPAELATGKPLVTKPEALTIIDEDLHCRGRPVAEDEHPAVERIVLEHVLAQAGQAVDPAAKIGWLDGRHDPHLRRELDHGAGFQKLRQMAAKSGGSTLLNRTRILAPPTSSNSIMHSQETMRAE